MKKKLIIVMMLSVVTIVATAQTYEPARVGSAFQSHQIMDGSAMYQGTVYQPFDNSTPAEQSYSPAQTPGGPRRGYDANGNWVPDSEDFGGGAETGESEQFPIGDAVLPLMLMAMLFAGVVYYRRKKALNC